MKKMLEPLQIRQKLVKNRVVFPPAVYFDNITNYEKMDDRRLAHYARIAQGGVGMIIVEATCIDSAARLTPGQLGLWEDTQIASMQQICKRIHQQDVCVCIQLHHGGGGTDIAVAIEPIVPSAYSYQGRNYREATEEDLYRIRHQFVAAALRAKEAGADGIELHGAHGYFHVWLSACCIGASTQTLHELENRGNLCEENCGRGYGELWSHLLCRTSYARGDDCRRLWRRLSSGNFGQRLCIDRRETRSHSRACLHGSVDGRCDRHS